MAPPLPQEVTRARRGARRYRRRAGLRAPFDQRLVGFLVGLAALALIGTGMIVFRNRFARD